MAWSTVLQLTKSLRDDPERAERLGFRPPDFLINEAFGRPKVVTRAVETRLADLVDAEKRAIDHQQIRFDTRYGDKCTDADGLRSLMCRLGRARLLHEGANRIEAARRVDHFAASAEFEKRLRSHKVRLSTFRRSRYVS